MSGQRSSRRTAKTTHEKLAHLAEVNRLSIDGLPALDHDHPMPPAM
ncbi:hypothetical protein [Mycobacterium leprae]|nr:hypothetical protein [Mycobacterium leprae]